MALYVAGLCGLAQGLGQVVRLLERSGFACDALVASGGAARSALVRQIVADATGRRVAAPETSEPVLLGAAMLGAVAAGRRTLSEAMTTMSKLGGVSEPAGGEIAALHAGKRRVFEALQEAERTARGAMRDCDGGGERKARPCEPERVAVWPKVIIFDCDGVIVDSETIALERTRAVLRRYGLELSAEQARERFLGVSAQAIRRMAERDLGAKLPANFLDELTGDIIAAFERELKGVDGRSRSAGGARRGRGLHRLVELARAHPRLAAHRRLHATVRAQPVLGGRSRARQAGARLVSACSPAHGRQAGRLSGDRGQRTGRDCGGAG